MNVEIVEKSLQGYFVKERDMNSCDDMSNPVRCKLYICVREDVPDFITPTLVAHAVLRHHLHWHEYATQEDAQYKNWLEESFKKCVVRVNLKEFEKIRNLHETHQMHITESRENKTLNGEVSCVTVVAEEGNIPNVLKFAKLWKPRELE